MQLWMYIHYIVILTTRKLQISPKTGLMAGFISHWRDQQWPGGWQLVRQLMDYARVSVDSHMTCGLTPGAPLVPWIATHPCHWLGLQPHLQHSNVEHATYAALPCSTA